MNKFVHVNTKQNVLHNKTFKKRKAMQNNVYNGFLRINKHYS